MALATKTCFFLLLTSCGNAVHPESQNAPRTQDIPLHCVLTEAQVEALKHEPFLLIQKVIANEPAFDRMQFAKSLSAWQDCYKSL